MEEDSMTNQRQKVLKATASSITGLSLLGTSITASAQEGDTDINPDFKPERKKQVIEFSNKFNNLNEGERQNIWDELDQSQRQAFHDANRVRSANVSKVGSANTASIQSVGNDHTDTYQFNLYGLGGLGGVKVFELHHRVMWDTEGDEIVDADSKGWVDDIGAFWSDEGNVKAKFDEGTSVSDEPLLFSTRQRKMTYAGGPNGAFTDRPETTIKAFLDGGSAADNCDGDGLGIENVDGPVICDE